MASAKVALLESKLKDKEKIISDYKRDIHLLQNSVKTSTKKIHQLTEEKDQHKLHAEHEAKDRKSSLQALTSINKDLNSLKDELKQKEQQIKSRDRTIADLQKKIQSGHLPSLKIPRRPDSVLSNYSKADNSQQNEALMKRILSLQKENELLNTRNGKTDRKLLQINKQLEDEKETLKTSEHKNKDFQLEIKKLKKEIDLLKKPTTKAIERRPSPVDTTPHRVSSTSKSPKSGVSSITATPKTLTKYASSIVVTTPSTTKISTKQAEKSPEDKAKKEEKESKLTPSVKDEKRTSIVSTKKLATSEVRTRSPTTIQKSVTPSSAGTSRLSITKLSTPSIGSTPRRSLIETTPKISASTPQLTKLRQELTQKHQAELMERDKLIGQMKSKLKEIEGGGCFCKEHSGWKEKIETLEGEISNKDINIVHQQNLLTELEANIHSVNENEKIFKEQIGELEQKLASCPNPDQIERLSAQIEDLQKQVIEYQNKYEQSLRRRTLKPKDDSATQKINELMKKVSELEWAIMYGDTEKDKQIGELKMAHDEEIAYREKEKNKISEREVRMKNQMRKYQQASVEEWLFEDGDIALF